MPGTTTGEPPPTKDDEEARAPARAAPSPPEPASPATARASSPPTAASDEQLALERNLLEMARTALARNRPAEAIARLEEHERRFADGSLVEEREVLAVHALSRAHDLAGARERAQAFERRFPQSLLLSAVRQATKARSSSSATGSAGSSQFPAEVGTTTMEAP